MDYLPSSQDERSTNDSDMVPKSTIEILSQEIDDEFGLYRVRAGDRVHYLNIPTNFFDEDTMSRPYLLIPKLPDFPDRNWSEMRIDRGSDGSLDSKISYDELPSVKITFHPQRINVLSLHKTKRLGPRVSEVLYNGHPAVAKIACFDREIPRLEVESAVYEVLMQHQKEQPHKTPIMPNVLGQLTENGRVIGLLLEKVEGDFASIGDLPKCEKILRKLHSLGVIHGDINRYNFMINRTTGGARMVDFEHAKIFTEEKAKLELESLESELVEETGRGARMKEISVVQGQGK